MAITVLVVEPDQTARDRLREQFHSCQFSMSVLYGPAQLISRVELECPSLILMRAEAPMHDAREAIASLRDAGYELPVFVISSSGEISDKIVFFELGADDYIVDPVNPHELTARIKRAVQRAKWTVCDAPNMHETISLGACEIDFATRRLVREGREIALRSNEFALLKLFTANPMRALTRSTISTRLGKPEIQDSSLDVAICRLRGLIEEDPSNPKLIQTLRGRGYMFVPLSVLS
jgi:two-component system, OmpR family, phosphate regulon response regulator OmpR